MGVCVRVLGEIRARWRKSKRGGKKDYDWNHDKLGSGSCTGFLVHPVAILPDPQIPVVNGKHTLCADINTLEDCVKLHTYSSKPCKQIR